MKTKPTISVLVPTFDRADIIASTVVSIQRQTLPVDEIIIADDGSADETHDVIAGLCREPSNRKGQIVYFRQANQGKSVALNAALEKATGEWIAFNDSDDLWMPNKLERQFAVLAAHSDCRACVSDTQFGDNAATTLQRSWLTLHAASGELPDCRMLFSRAGHGIMMQTIVVHRDVMRAVGGFDPALRTGQDIDILFRIALQTRVCFVNAPLVILDRSPERSRLTVSYPMQSIVRLQQRVHMVQKWNSLARSEDAALRRALRARLGAVRSALANQLLQTEQYGKACYECLNAYRATRNPRMLLKWLLIVLVPRLARALYSKTTVVAQH